MQVKNLDNLLTALRIELDNADAMASAIISRGLGSPSFSTGNVSDKTSVAAIKIAELKRELDEQLKKYVTLKLTATRLINQMDDKRYMAVLYHYYLQNRTLEGTAGEMNRSYQNVCKLHGRALVEFQKLMDQAGIS